MMRGGSADRSAPDLPWLSTCMPGAAPCCRYWYWYSYIDFLRYMCGGGGLVWRGGVPCVEVGGVNVWRGGGHVWRGGST